MKGSNKAFVALAFSITAVMYGIVYLQNLHFEEPLTEFYIIGSAEGYPLNLEKGELGRVIVGVANHEFEDVEYKLAIVYENETLREQWITLRNGKKWEEEVKFKLNKAGKHKLEFLLYRDGKLYRRLHLWMNVSGYESQ